MSTKKKVLEILEQNRGHTISGQELANKLEVTRTSIWKAIKSLREDGHIIQAATNKGYYIDRASNRISPEGILPYLTEQNKNFPIIVYKTIDSTNTQAKRLMINGAEHGTIILSDEQTAGRGRFGRRFISPAETGLYMSIILKTQNRMEDSLLITVVAAVSVCRAIEKLTNLKPKIKWVNDIYLNHKKICGILTEAVTGFESGRVDSIVVGIGINCNTSELEFPQELREIVGSLSLPNLSKNHLAAEIVNNILSLQNDVSTNGIIDEYRERSFLMGKNIFYEKDGILSSATVLDINESGNLVIKMPNGHVDVLFSGEVSLSSNQF